MHILASAGTLTTTTIMGTTSLISVLLAEVTVVTIMSPVRRVKDGGTEVLVVLVVLPAAVNGALIEVVGVVEVTVITFILSSSTQRWILYPPPMRSLSPSNSPVLRRRTYRSPSMSAPLLFLASSNPRPPTLRLPPIQRNTQSERRRTRGIHLLMLMAIMRRRRRGGSKVGSF